MQQGIRDQLYLQHQPQYYVIEEDEEAVRYPQLFRHRLLTNRPDWMQKAKRLSAVEGKLRKLHASSTRIPCSSHSQQRELLLSPIVGEAAASNESAAAVAAQQ